MRVVLIDILLLILLTSWYESRHITLCPPDWIDCGNERCVAEMWRCDGYNDCGNFNDEKDCGDPCENANCSQNCKNIPKGPQCYCNDGYLLDVNDNKTCNDINECQQEGFCSHDCTNTRGGYECTCRNGYELVNRTCKASGVDPLLIYSSLKEVRGIRLRSNQVFLVARAVTQASAVDLDPKRQRVYWIELSNRSTIYTVKIDGSRLRTVLSHGLLVPEDIAVDYITKNIYITDSGLRQILVCKADGRMCHVLHENVEKPRSIVLDPDSGLMYWSDWSERSGGIYRSGMDGSKRISMVSNNIGWPNDIALDHTTNRIYWVDAKMKTIEFLTLDGTVRKVLLNTTVYRPYSLAVFEDTIYWSDWETFSLESCNKFTGHKTTILTSQRDRRIMGVNVYHPVLASKVSNPCRSNNCSHMCLMSPVKGFSCACPHGFKLSTDERTCESNRCSADDFQCKNGQCIVKSWRCDFKDDCGDNSDEEDCPSATVCNKEYHLMTCLNGECVPELWRCDGQPACSDGSDELNCNATVCDDRTLFRCGNGQCVLKLEVCDGMIDCLDGSDEINCNGLSDDKTQCNDIFLCKDGSRINVCYVCDGAYDCMDKTDEINCNAKTECKEDMFLCKDGSCINASKVCDGYTDCNDKEDEMNCSAKIKCSENMFMCNDGACIYDYEVCDGHSNCKGNEDETNCGDCTRLRKHRCIDGTCIHDYQICDGKKDCSNNEDELYCLPSSNRTAVEYFVSLF